jgi:sodium transport system permease protein
MIMNSTTEFLRDASREQESKVLRWAVVDDARAPGLVAALTAEPSFVRTTLRDEAIADAIRSDALDFVLVLREGAAAQTVAELHYDNAPLLSRVKKRVDAVVERANVAERDVRLAELGLDDAARRTAVLEPVQLELHGTATAREVLGEAMGGVLPYLMIVFCFLGALYPATDLGAGEKERGTLETLLLAPVSRTTLVLGKFAVVFTTGVTSALLGTLGLGWWARSKIASSDGSPLGEVLSAIGPGDLAMVALLLVPIAAIIGALLLSVSIYAKSFKEAQSYSAPLNLLLLMPAFLAMLPGVALDWRWAMIPMANVSLAIKEIVKGTLSVDMLLLVFASTAAIAAALLGLCVRWFQRERVLFRQ